MILGLVVTVQYLEENMCRTTLIHSYIPSLKHNSEPVLYYFHFTKRSNSKSISTHVSILLLKYRMPTLLSVYLQVQLHSPPPLRFRGSLLQFWTGVLSVAAASSSPVPSTTRWTPCCAAPTHW